MICRVLASRSDADELIVVKSPEVATYIKTEDWLYNPVGEGEFACNGDKQVVLPIAEQALDTKASFLDSLGEGAIVEHRFFKAIAARLLAGLRERSSLMQQHVSMNSQNFLKKYKFCSLETCCAVGFGPIAVAAIENNPEIVIMAIEATADVNQTLTMAKPELNLQEGQAPLHLAALYGNVEVASALLVHNALIEQRSSVGATPLHSAAKGGTTTRPQMVQLLLSLRASPSSRGYLGTTPLMSLAFAPPSGILAEGSKECIEALLSARASVHECADTGCDSLLWVAMFDGDVRIARQLLQYGSDVNRRLQVRTSKLKVLTVVARLLYRLGDTSESVRIFAEAPSGTCLHMAAMNGRRDFCQTLIDARADTGIQN